MYALNLDKETGRILSVTYPEYAPADAVIVETLPEGNVNEYIYCSNNLTNEEYEYSPIQKPNENIIQQIINFKNELSITDYKIIKCSEAQLVGEELPYDIITLHAERQAIRDKINELEVSVI